MGRIWRKEIKLKIFRVFRNEAASNAADSDRCLSSIADDILFIPPNEPAYVDKEAFRSYFQQIFGKFTVQEKYVVEGVKVSSNLAVAHVTYSGYQYTQRR